MRMIQWAVCMAAAVVSSPAFSAIKYKVTDVGPWGARALNNEGQVVGFDGLTGAAWVWQDGITTSLNLPAGKLRAAPEAINDSGLIVGYADDADGVSLPFTWSGLVPSPAGDLGGGFGIVYGVNASGQSVGASVDSGGVVRAVTFSGGAASLISGLEAREGAASDISDNGLIVGAADDEAFLWKDGAVQFLGTLGTRSFSAAVNSNGQVVGTNQFGDTVARAFLWSSGVMTDLGTLGGEISTAFDINADGLVVGSSQNGASRRFRAFLYSSGRMQDLNDLIDPTSGWTLLNGWGINDRGQIVGQGSYLGNTRGFLLTPISGAIPEPATWAMLIAGFGVVGMAARRRGDGGLVKAVQRS